jgi:outer membrane biosynthesis protein TonB
MNPRLRRQIFYTAMAHVGLIVVVIVGALVGHVRKKKPHEIVAVIDVQTSLQDVSTPQPVEKIEIPAPPEPPPQPPPDPIPEKPKPKLKKADEIKISKKRIRSDAPRPKPKKTASPDEVRKLLESGLSPARPTDRPVSEASFATYLALVRQTMYAAWDQPSELSGSAGLMTEATLRVLQDGTITRKAITRSSGNRTMDDSVRKALSAVTRLKKLPPGFGGSHKDIAIEFELTGATL